MSISNRHLLMMKSCFSVENDSNNNGLANVHGAFKSPGTKEISFSPLI